MTVNRKDTGDRSDGALDTGALNALGRTRFGPVLYNRHDIYLGRSIATYGEYSHFETELFRIFAREGATVLDIGANIGYHTLSLSRFVGPKGRVIAFEPQRLIFQLLCANMALNSVTNVDCRQGAVGGAPGTLLVPPLDYGRDNNFGGLGLGERYARGEPVAVIPIDQLQLPACRFIKVDVEGMEIDVLRGAVRTIERFQPALYLENDRREKSPPLIQFLLALDYRLFWHLPPLFNPDNFLAAETNIFPGLLSVNLLCLPKSALEGVPGAFQGFKEVTRPDDWYR